MAEALTRELMSELLGVLLVAFPQKGRDVEKLATVYRNSLSDLAGEALRYAVKRHIQDGKYFPKVSELREIGADWMRRNMPSPAVIAERDGTACQCGHPFQWLQSYRPASGDRGIPKITADGKWVRLEIVSRFLCPNCAPPPNYRADPDAPEQLAPAMRIMGEDGKVRVPIILLRRHPGLAQLAAKAMGGGNAPT